MELKENEVFNNRYLLLEFIGAGSSGEVWQVRDTITDEVVAIKVYSSLDPKGLKEFVGEYMTVHRFSHPNLLVAKHLDICGHSPFLIMPYCPGNAGNTAGEVTEHDIWLFVRDVASGLEYLHTQDIIHRDIKPDNVLVSESGVYMLSDFGLSMKMKSTLRKASGRALDASGTIGYMAPELFGGKPQGVKATDIWALGVSIYEMACGELPFCGQGGVLLKAGADLPELDDKFSQDLKSVIQRCLAKETWDRPTAAELKDIAQAKLDNPSQPVAAAPKRQGQSDELESFTVNGVTFTMVQVEGGTFQMGAHSNQESEAYSDEKPLHSVTLGGYKIGQTEVTQALWEAVMGTNPSFFKGSHLPVEQVSWNDCQEFIRRLNNLTGRSFRLPTEAEWEFAARGGNKSRGYKYAGGDRLGSVAWYTKSVGRTHPVGTKQPNELGLYDMSGNVWEWCQDWYSSSYYGSSTSNNPKGPSSGSYHVSRGGGWYSCAQRCRSSERCSGSPGNTYINLGFRLAL